jgi:lysophospholipase L1-like esterase
MRVLVAGNSVALYIRPRDPGARPYGHLLRDRLQGESAQPVDVDIRAENSQTVADLVADCEESLVAWAPDVVIFQVGIVECTPRVVPHALRRRFVKGRTPVERLWLAGEALVRRPLVGLLGGAPAMSPRAFQAGLTRLCSIGRGEAGARVLCIGIHETTARVTREVPGIQEQIRTFDGAIRAACAASGASYVDPAPVVAELGLDAASPDGIHFSAEGHRRLAARLHDALRVTPAHAGANGNGAASHARGQSGTQRALASLPAALLFGVAIPWIPVARLFRRSR